MGPRRTRAICRSRPAITDRRAVCRRFFDLDQDHVGYWHDAGEGERAGRHDDGIDQLGASKLMADMLVQKYYGGKYWATDICKL